MRRRSVPRSDPHNHSRSPWPNPKPRSSAPQTSRPSQLKAKSSILAEGQEKAPSLSSDWLSVLGSVKDDPQNRLQQLWRQPTLTDLGSSETTMIRALPRVSFDIPDLTVLYHCPRFPRKGNWEGNSRPNPASPDFLQYLHIVLAVNTQR